MSVWIVPSFETASAPGPDGLDDRVVAVETNRSRWGFRSPRSARPATSFARELTA